MKCNTEYVKDHERIKLQRIIIQITWGIFLAKRILCHFAVPWHWGFPVALWHSSVHPSPVQLCSVISTLQKSTLLALRCFRGQHGAALPILKYFSLSVSFSISLCSSWSVSVGTSKNVARNVADHQFFYDFDLRMCFSPGGVQFLLGALATDLRNHRFYRAYLFG